MLQGKENDLDLLPHEWKSADVRRKPKEPFFGPGLWDAFWYAAGFTVAALVVRYFVL